MKALSIKQPWAWLYCTPLNLKDVENRNWRIGRKTSPAFGDRNADFRIELPQRIYIHAGKVMDTSAGDFIAERLNRLQSLELANAIRNGLPLGAIIGEVTITECVEKSDSPWFTGKYGFVRIDPVLYKTPIPCRGQLGFFNLPSEVEKQIQEIKTDG